MKTQLVKLADGREVLTYATTIVGRMFYAFVPGSIPTEWLIVDGRARRP